MRRSRVFIASVGILLVSLLMGGGAIVSAQDSASTDFSGHALTGSWTLMTDPNAFPDQVLFTSDGSYLDIDGVGNVTIGAWKPTDDNSANLSFTVLDQDGAYIIRATIEVAADGQSFTGTSTFEAIDTDTGQGIGQYGPIEWTATRMVAEAPGTPVGSLEDLFTQFAATPEATPAP